MQKINRMNQARLRESGEYDIMDAIQFQKNDIGRLILRLAIGGLMLFHGMNKVLYGHEQVDQILLSVGIPAFLSFGVFIGEVLAPVLLILGQWTRLAGFFIAVDMFIATLLVHSAQMDEINQMGGWMLELNALYFFGGIALMFLGSGHIATSKGKGVLD
jgi:putative oxidoreductase